MHMNMELDTQLSVAIELDAQIHEMIARLNQYDDPDSREAIDSLLVVHQHIVAIIQNNMPKD